MKKELTVQQTMLNKNKNRWIKIGVTMEQLLGVQIPADDPLERIRFADVVTEMVIDGMFTHYIDYLTSSNDKEEKEGGCEQETN